LYWKLGTLFGNRSFYNGNWLKRAAAARAGIYGNDVLEATYPMTRTDTSGEPLDGSKHNYTLTFAADQLPPVNAFWSVTMYDGKTQFLIKNPINRYLINSPMLTDMHKNEDGSEPRVYQRIYYRPGRFYKYHQSINKPDSGNHQKLCTAY
jgi:hypothetical protein